MRALQTVLFQIMVTGKYSTSTAAESMFKFPSVVAFVLEHGGLSGVSVNLRNDDREVRVIQLCFEVLKW